MKKHAVIGLTSAIGFALLVVILKTVDVSSSVGLSGINTWFYNRFPFNTVLYDFSKYLGCFALFFVLVFAFAGFLQLVRRKSISKIDSSILLLGALYIVTALVYLVFTKVVVNMRPVVIGGANEASFPSSHTILFIVVFSSASLNSSVLFKRPVLSKIFKVCCLLLLIEGVALRLFCGVHWLTDIIGGVLLSVSLLEFYRYFYERFSCCEN